MVNFWIITTVPEAWEVTKTQNVHAFNHEADRDKVKPGDKAIIYLVRSKPPVFVGVYEIAKPWEETKEPFWPDEKAQGEVLWPWKFQLTPLRPGAVDVRKLSKDLSFVQNKQAWSIYFMGSVGNFGRPIAESDYLLIFDEFLKQPVTWEVKPAPQPKIALPTKIPKLRKIPQLRGTPPSHYELRDMILDIGLMRNLVAETEYPIDALRLDVAWRPEVQKFPSQAWEVHIGGDFYEALAKLNQAWNYWKAEPFLVTTEKSAGDARKLVGGMFPEIKPYLRIILWQEIVRLYRALRELTDIEEGLRLKHTLRVALQNL